MTKTLEEYIAEGNDTLCAIKMELVEGNDDAYFDAYCVPLLHSAKVKVALESLMKVIIEEIEGNAWEIF